jgi:hypothetical protein
MTCGLCGLFLAMISIASFRPAYADGLTPDERIGVAFSASGCTAPVANQTRGAAAGVIVVGNRAIPRPRPSGGEDGRIAPVSVHSPVSALDCESGPDGAPSHAVADEAADNHAYPDSLVLISLGQYGAEGPVPEGQGVNNAGDPYSDWIAAGEIGWEAGEDPIEPSRGEGGK